MGSIEDLVGHVIDVVIRATASAKLQTVSVCVGPDTARGWLRFRRHRTSVVRKKEEIIVEVELN